MTTIRDILGVLDDLNGRHAIYFLPGPVEIGTQCIVDDPDDTPLNAELPVSAQDAGFSMELGVEDVREIRENARQQGRGQTIDEMLRALNYYLENDAFLDFDEDDALNGDGSDDDSDSEPP